MTTEPFVSVVTPVADPPEAQLRSCAASVLGQTDGDLEWVVVDDGCNPATRGVLRELADSDPRVRLVTRDSRGGIVAATNDGLALAQGRYVAFVDHDDELVPGALEAVRGLAVGDVDLVYSDEWVCDEDGGLRDVVRKSGFSPERLRAHNYVNHLVVARTSLVHEVGDLRHGFDGSQDHDLVLRLVERARVVLHLPEVLYHWRASPASVLSGGLDSKQGAWEAGRRAVAEHLDRIGADATVEELQVGDLARWYRVRRTVPPGTTTALVVAVPGDADGVSRARASLTSALQDPGLDLDEVVVVGGPSAGPALSALVDSLDAGRTRTRSVTLHADLPRFEMLNHGVAACDAAVLLVLDVGVRLTTPGWAHELVGHLSDPTVGVVAGLAVDADGTIESSGYALVGRVPEFLFRGLPRSTTAAAGAALVPGERTAAPATCWAVRRDVFTHVGGFSRSLGERFADVDLCLKTARLGRRHLVTPLVEVQVDRPPAPVEQHAGELERLRARWWPELDGDPYVNPALRTAPWLTTRP